MPLTLSKLLLRKKPSSPVPPLGEVTRRAGRAPALGDLNRLGSAPIHVLKRMRLDPQIALGLSAIKAPIIGVNWWAESTNPEAARFVEAALSPLWREVVRAALLAVDFGFQAAEKVWEVRDVEYRVAGARTIRRAAVYKKLRDIDPASVTLTIDDAGAFAGARLDSGAFLPPEKCFVMTLSKEWGDLYGRSRLDAAYEPWYWASVMYSFANRYFERKGDPAIIGRAPAEERIDAEGNRVRTLDEAARVISSLRAGGTAVFPDERDDAGNLRWDFQYLLDDKRADMFISYIEHLQVMKLRAILVPERIMTQDSSTGSYAMAAEHTETFLRNEETLLSEVVEHVNRYIVRPLVDYNFGPDLPVRIETSGVRNRNAALLRDILFKVIDAENATAAKTALVAGAGPASRDAARAESATASLIDSVRLLEELNVPHK